MSIAGGEHWIFLVFRCGYKGCEEARKQAPARVSVSTFRVSGHAGIIAFAQFFQPETLLLGGLSCTIQVEAERE